MDRRRAASETCQLIPIDAVTEDAQVLVRCASRRSTSESPIVWRSLPPRGDMVRMLVRSAAACLTARRAGHVWRRRERGAASTDAARIAGRGWGLQGFAVVPGGFFQCRGGPLLGSRLDQVMARQVEEFGGSEVGSRRWEMR